MTGAAGQPAVAEGLLAEARQLAVRAELGTAGARAAALLGRSALEEGMWSLFPPLKEVSGRAMLLTFGVVTKGAAGMAAAGPAAAVAWSRLSAASHHHAYEMPLTTAELDHLLDLVHDVIAAIRERQASRARVVTRATGR